MQTTLQKVSVVQATLLFSLFPRLFSLFLAFSRFSRFLAFSRYIVLQLGRRDEIQSQACAARVQKIMEYASSDIRFDVPLADACFEDRQEFCANVSPGSARVIRCLQDRCPYPILPHPGLITDVDRCAWSGSCGLEVHTLEWPGSIHLLGILYLASVVLTLLLCAVSEARSDKLDVCQEAFQLHDCSNMSVCHGIILHHMYYVVSKSASKNETEVSKAGAAGAGT